MAGKQDIKAGSAYVELALKGGASLRKGLAAAVGQLKSVATAAATAGAVMGAATVGVFAAATKQFLETGDALDKMRQRTGLSVEAISKLDHAAGQSGASLEDVENGVRKMQREIGKAGDASKETTDALDAMNLRMEDLQKLSPEEQFNTLASEIGKISDPTKRAAMAMQFFGKSGTKLLPMIEDFDALKQEAEDMGFVMSGSAAAASVKLGDKFANLWKTVKFGALALGEALAPALDFAVTHIQTFATKALKIVQLMAVDWRLGGQIAVTGLQLGLLKGIGALSEVVGGAMGDFIGTIGQQILAGDFSGAFSTTIAGLADLWAGFSEGMVAVFTGAMRIVTDAWETVTSSISDWILENAAEGGILGKLAMLGTGVDFQEEVERARQLDAERKRRGLGGTDEDPLAAAQRMAREGLGAKADEFRSGLSEIDKAAQARTAAASAEFKKRSGGGADVNPAIAAAQADLDRLLAEAARRRAEMDAAFEAEKNGALAGAGELAMGGGPKNRVAGSFSAAAASAMGQGVRDMAAEEIKKLSSKFTQQWLREREERRAAGRML